MLQHKLTPSLPRIHTFLFSFYLSKSSVLRLRWSLIVTMSPMDRVDIALVSTEDVPPCFRVVSKSFGHDAPFVDMYFPNHDTPSGQVQGSSRLAAWRQGSQDSTFLKAVIRDDQGDQEHIIGLAVWTHMKDPPPAALEEVEDVEEIWPDVNDREFMTRLWRDYVVPRTQAIIDSGGKGVYGK
jgi:hypothetical protein